MTRLTHFFPPKLTLLAVVWAAPACGDGGVVCGEGTDAVDGRCVTEIACGAGTVEEDGECVPIDSGPAPTLAAIEPPADFLGGGATFTLTGTGFRAPGAGNTEVRFGGVPALFTIESDGTITGTVPLGDAKAVEVTVANGNGAASVAFEYTGLYAADGKAGIPGNLYLVDPRDGAHIALGPIASDNGTTAHGVTGLAFDATGALFASESTTGEAAASLLSLDPSTGSATVVGPLVDVDGEEHQSVPDLTFSGDVLLGWTENRDDAIAVNVATGTLTVLADSGVSTSGSGLATLNDGTVVLAATSVGEDLFTIDPVDGRATAVATLADERTNGLAVNSMTVFHGVLFAVLSTNDGVGLIGSILASIDPTTGVVTPLGALPGGVDALASSEPFKPSVGALSLARVPAAPPFLGQTTPAGCAEGTTGTVRAFVAGVLVADLSVSSAAAFDTVPLSFGKRGRRGVPVSGMVGDLNSIKTVSFVPCRGEPLVVPATQLAADAERYVLTPNQRGQMKLVDRATGSRPLRNVIAVRAN